MPTSGSWSLHSKKKAVHRPSHIDDATLQLAHALHTDGQHRLPPYRCVVDPHLKVIAHGRSTIHCWMPWRSEPNFCFPPCGHAKCVVADEKKTFITSANLTENALDRNIEVGVLFEDKPFARSLVRHFQRLVEEELLQPLPGAS